MGWSERLERDADDPQPTRESLERKPANLIAGGAECLPIGVAAVGWCERLSDRGEQLAELCADPVGRSLVTRGLAQKPHAVADVALFVVVDVAVAVHEP